MIAGLIIGFLYLFSDFFYWVKWTASVVALWLKKIFQPRRFDLYDFDVEYQPERLGIIIPKDEKILESPFPEEHLQDSTDEIFIYGMNSCSQALVVKISRSCNGDSTALIYLKLAGDHWYELEDTKGYQSNFDGKYTSFTCGGLQMYYLSPMRRWRIVYCGILRERNHVDEKEKKHVFVKFTFIWTASSDVYDGTSDLYIRTTADAIAQANWNSLFPPVQKTSETLNAYAQSGVVNGVVSIEEEPDIEMHLFGERLRYMGKVSHLAGSKFKLILGVIPYSGLTFHLEKASVPNTFHNICFGFVVNPNSNISNIEDGVIISRTSGTDEMGRNLTAVFTAGKQYELNGNFTENGLHLRSESSAGRSEMIEINFEIDGLKGRGFIISEEISKSEIVNQKQIRKYPSLLRTTRSLTVYFTEEASRLSELTGGKGSSLGKLTRLTDNLKSEFVVPKGIIVTTEAYKEFLTSEIIEKIENLKDIAYGKITGDIQEACKIVQTTVKSAYLPDKITKEIENKLSKLFAGNINQVKFAVRSSATGEDTDQMSAAGQMETFLGIQGIKEVFTAVKKCWASQFGYIPVEYKRQNGQILNSPMAVVIQEMVECDSSGVLFTCDPVTNNPSVSVITGNYGLGESVVSGSEEPDTIVLRKLPNKDLEIRNVILGLKEHKIVLTEKQTSKEGGTVVEDVPEESRNECCITPEMAIKLGKLSIKIEEYFKSPRDIEWGIKDNTIYILQSRPITTSASISDYEIQHEFDGPLRSEGDFFTTCNVAEAMPGAVSPLGIDIMVKYFGMAFKGKIMKHRQKTNFHKGKYFASGLVPFYNHLFLSVIELLSRMESNEESLMTQSMMIGVFGRLLNDPEMIILSNQRYGSVNSKPGLTFLWDLFFVGSGIPQIREQVFNYKIPAKNGKTSKEIFELLIRSSSDCSPAILKHITCSGMSAVWNMFVFIVLASDKGALDNDVYSDFAKLLASSANVESADVPSAMQVLAKSIVKEIGKETFKEMSVEEARKWLETSSTAAGKNYRQFMKRHGHRCIKELDVYSIPWYEDPESLIKSLQTLSDCCEDAKEKKEADLSSLLPHLTTQLNLKSRLLMKLILPNSRRGIREREWCKSSMVKAFDNVRKGFLHLSKCMVAEGYLPEKDLVFFLTIDEISDLLETRNSKLIARAKHRRKLFPQLDNLRFPEISKGYPVSIHEEQYEPVEYVADLTMTGIPVSQGIVKGYARIAPTLKEAAFIKPGEILITHSTDIGWSPFFPILAGVVTELGGLISHGAVVSREYGLPCVVGLHGATKQFVTGDYVLLDGNKGILQRLSSPGL